MTPRTTTWGLVALVIGLATVVLSAPEPAGAQSEGLPRAGFDWEMEERFGFDRDGDGVLEIENTTEYVHNRRPGSCPPAGCPQAKFGVSLVAGPTPGDLGVTGSVVAYEWRISGPGTDGVYHEVDPEVSLLLGEGEYDVDLRVRVRLPWGSVTQRARGVITVDDLVVVALGDSYASGEGNPDRPITDGVATWADAADETVRAEHAAAHRSTVGWPTRVALGLEDLTRHSSVTFLNFTSSGARIDRGILGERSQPPLPAQLDALEAVIGDREVDIVLLQVGGNDVGFSRLIRALVDADPQLDPVCYHVMLANTWAAIEDGAWDRGVRVRYRFPFDIRCEPRPATRSVIPGLNGLDDAFARLAARLDGLDVGTVVLTEYPDPTGSPTPGEACREIVGDVTPPFGFHEVDEQEQAAGIELLLEPLNDSLASIADQEGWVFVDGISAAFFDGHGYCADWPEYGYPDWFTRSPLLLQQRLDVPEGWYRPPGRYGSPLLLNDGPVSWYRTAAQSAVLQGPVPRFLTAGTLHPNEQGHLAIARMVLSALAGR